MSRFFPFLVFVILECFEPTTERFGLKHFSFFFWGLVDLGSLDIEYIDKLWSLTLNFVLARFFSHKVCVCVKGASSSFFLVTLCWFLNNSFFCFYVCCAKNNAFIALGEVG
uniref:(northern house mosquito) hypothetical protein n=1 Tax=Culex pipiens TaxID=7175 RepID=A0A8D8P908_CULPI